MQPLNFIFSITNTTTHKIIKIVGLKIKIRRKNHIIEIINKKFEEENRLQEKLTHKILQEISEKIESDKNNIIANNYAILDHIYKNIVEQFEICKAENRQISYKNSSKIFETICLTAFPAKDIYEELHKIYLQYPKATGFLKEIQTCNLELLSKLKEICDELNIKFWLHAGTLIGAIRHNGFIPWDDDVDVAMLREDFNTLKKYISENNKYEIAEYYNDLTCSKHHQFKLKTKEIPNFIDIVIYDRCKITSQQELEGFQKKYNIIRDELIQKFINELKSPKVNDIGYYHVGEYDTKTKEKVDRIIDYANSKLINNTQKEDCYYFYAIENYPFIYPIMKDNEIFPLKTSKFETIELNIPQNAIKYLDGYGNIFHPPGNIQNLSHVYVFNRYRNNIEKYVNNTKGA